MGETRVREGDVKLQDFPPAAFPRVVVTQTKSPRALSADDYARILREAGADVVATYPTVEAAALALCEESYVACGSITLAGELAGLFC